MKAAAWVALIPLLTGCVVSDSYLRGELKIPTDVGEFDLEFPASDDGARAMIQHALESVSPLLTRWGGLKEPVRIAVLPNHELFERAVNKSHYDWLRAWARYDEVSIQSPSTWTFLGTTQRSVDELVLHELTHCVMYQQSATRDTWRRKAFPIWFSEGMASFTAGQGYRWPTLEDLSVFMNTHPGLSPVWAPVPLYQTRTELVYGAGHHAFTFLVGRYGEPAVRTIMNTMASGEVFPVAFSKVIGMTPESFLADFERYVRWRAFRNPHVPTSGAPAMK